MATAHLLYGFIGSGKTTLAKRLERDLHAVRFTPDEWMVRLFGHDPPATIFEAKALAISELLEPVWTRCLSCGVDVVLDYGFWSRRERDRARVLAAAVGAKIKLHILICDDAEAIRRLSLRNADPELNLHIAPSTYEFLQLRIEPLGADELLLAMLPGTPG